jgi:prefoldin subunit 5
MALRLNLKAPVTKEQIKKELEKIRAEIKKREGELKLLRAAVQHYQSQCDHAGQQTGHNERDGSWANPCPTCGYNY